MGEESAEGAHIILFLSITDSPSCTLSPSLHHPSTSIMKLSQITFALAAVLSTATAQGLASLPDCAVWTTTSDENIDPSTDQLQTIENLRDGLAPREVRPRRCLHLQERGFPEQHCLLCRRQVQSAGPGEYVFCPDMVDVLTDPDSSFESQPLSRLLTGYAPAAASPICPPLSRARPRRAR